MKDILKDIIDHTFNLGVIDLIKISGTVTETNISGMSPSPTVIFTGKFKTPVADFVGTFGMPNLHKLKTILGFSEEYDENAVITVQTQGGQPATIHFENKTGDFVNDYRLMDQTIVEAKVKLPHFKGAKWDVSFQPTVAGIQRLKKQSMLHSEDEIFKTTLTKGNLSVQFGSPTNYSGNFVFHPGISGSLTKTFGWPVKQFISIMDLVGDKTIYISDLGVMRITVDSGLTEYEYLVPAVAK